MKAILMRILILIAILSVSFYFIYKDYLSPQKPIFFERLNLSKNKGILEIVPVGNPTGTTSPDKVTLKGKLPDIDKKWVMPANYDSETKRIVSERVAAINESLKANQEQYDKWIDLGVLRKLVGDYSEARNIWEFAAITWPDSMVAYHNLGDLYHFYLKDDVKAEENMRKVIEIDPHYIAEYSLLYDLLKKPDILLKGLDSNPKSVDLMIAVASSYKNAGEAVNAKKYYEMALVRAKELGNASLQKSLEGEIASLRSQ